MGLEWQSRRESSCPREGQGTPGSQQSLRKSAKAGSLAVSRIHSSSLRMFTGEDPEQGGEGRLGRSSLSGERGSSLGIQQPWAQTPRAPLQWGSAWLSSSAQLERNGQSLVLLLFVLDPSTSCPSLPHDNILPVRLGETLSSPSDTSTNHTSSWMPCAGVSARLFWVVSHPSFTLCPLGPVRPPGEASPSLQFTRVTCRKRLIVQSRLQTQLLSSLHRSRA